MIMWMSDISKEHLRKEGGKTGIELFVAPHHDQPHGATHAVYQRTGDTNTIIGHAKFYTPRRRHEG